MKIGVRAHDFGRMDEVNLSKTIKYAGFEAVQLALTKAILGINSFKDIDERKVYSIREAFEKVNLEINVLGCYIEPSLEDRVSRLEQVSFFTEGVDNAKILGAPIIGTETTNFSLNLGEDLRQKAYERLKDSVLRMVEKAEKANVIVGIETVAEHTLNSASLTRRLLDEVKSEKLKVIFDPVNLLIPSTYLNQDQIFNEFFDLVGKDIVVVHLKDVVISNGEKIWRNIGKGIVNYEPIFKWLKENKPDICVSREHVKMDSYKEDLEAIIKLCK